MLAKREPFNQKRSITSSLIGLSNVHRMCRKGAGDGRTVTPRILALNALGSTRPLRPTRQQHTHTKVTGIRYGSEP